MEEEYDEYDRPNVYYAPERFGCRILGSVQEPLSYEFNILLVLWKTSGEVYWTSDSGCSCPTPFEDVTALESCEQVTRGTFASFTEVVKGFAPPQGEWMEDENGEWSETFPGDDPLADQKSVLLYRVNQALSLSEAEREVAMRLAFDDGMDLSMAMDAARRITR